MRIFPFAICLFAAVASSGVERTFQLTFRIIDDEGKPLEKAEVGVSWENARARKNSDIVKGSESLSNKDGLVTLAGKTAIPGVSYGANLKGYYSSWGSRYHFKDARFLRWQPWNPTIEVVLKRRLNPVPMYARRMEARIPEFSKPLGYDLLISDWVAPYGKGKTADLFVEANREVRSDEEYDGTLAVSFPNDGDGLIPFEVEKKSRVVPRLPYQAPEEGYARSKTWRYRGGKNESGQFRRYSDVSEDMNYIIRVRTHRDAEGKITSAMYGKIHGDILWFIGTRASKSGFAFTYYVNPDGTRNLEYDMFRNLLKLADSRDSSIVGLEP